MSDLAERLDALRRKNDGLTEEELKVVYLDRLADGETPDEAAKALGKTSTWFRRRRSEKSSHYDEEFAERYEEVMHPEGEHRAALVQRARTALVEAAKTGNVRAIEKILMAYDPDFSFLRPAAFSGSVSVEQMFVQIAPSLPTSVLEQVRAALLEERKLQELPVVDVA